MSFVDVADRYLTFLTPTPNDTRKTVVLAIMLEYFFSDNLVQVFKSKSSGENSLRWIFV